MRKASLLTLSAVLVSAAASASPGVQARSASPRAAAAVQIADATQNVSRAAPAPVAPVAAVPAEKKICKQLPSSYSRVTVRTCLTAKEWKQVDEQSHD